MVQWSYDYSMKYYNSRACKLVSCQGIQRRDYTDTATALHSTSRMGWKSWSRKLRNCYRRVKFEDNYNMVHKLYGAKFTGTHMHWWGISGLWNCYPPIIHEINDFPKFRFILHQLLTFLTTEAPKQSIWDFDFKGGRKKRGKARTISALKKYPSASKYLLVSL